ncbi:polysaccharide biosynthesis protein [Actinophytocola xanthii]|uniref:Polysaccharide biosynthesis protein n=1 Tax=Actinophytocola xanthii TaxID=1912961 RepID=A0A1Q8CTU3_9PSEU|nr:polysaccharide biosynthesis protein [Actinophytocola xanthii]OLF17782.1 polysaccharide biosynthesis protein [Actinophytocola xanthii]
MVVAERVRVAALLVSVGVAFTQAASYLLNVAAARMLAPAAFGELGSLLAVLVVGAVPAMGLQTVTALRVARTRESGQLFSLGLATSAVVTAVALAAAPLLVVLLHLGSVLPALFVAVSLTSITLIGLWYGMLQGANRFAALAGLLACEAVGRIGGTLVGLVVFRDATAALAGTALGALAVAALGWFVVGRPRPSRHHRGHVGEVLHAVQAMLALVLLVNLDLVLARHHLPAGEAGEYAVGAIITKIAYWLPQAVAVLVLPRFAEEASRRRLVPRALAICAGLDAVVVLGTATAGPTVVRVVGGADYAGSSLPVWAFAVVGSLLSLTQILLFSRIASADRRSTVLIWLAVGVEVLLVSLWLHDGLTEVVAAAGIATGLLVAGGALVELRSRRVEPVDAGGHDGGDGQQ